MSLEQALAENTAAMKELTAMWSTLNRQAKKIDKDVANGELSVIKVADEKRIEVELPKQETAAPTPVAVAAVTTALPETAVASPVEVSYDQVSAAITNCAKTDRAKVVAVLGKFGAKKGPELKPEQYADFLKEIA